MTSSIFIACAAAIAGPAVEVPDGVIFERDVVYGKGGGRDLRLDLFRRKGPAAPAPAVVFIHGGGWRAGSRTQFHRQAAYLASKGYVCAAIEYRLVPEATFPAAIEDAKCAVRWLRANAARYGVDPERIAASGGSAGGHLAALIGTTDSSNKLEGTGGSPDASSRVQAVVAFNPVLDLEILAKGKALPPGNMLERFLGATYADKPDLYRLASPMAHIDAKDPPFLILHGTEDKLVPYAQAVAFKEKLEKAGVAVELYSAEGAGHGFFNRDPHYQPTLEAMEAFLEKHLRKGIRSRAKPAAPSEP
ncbi:MAG: alpha/beta hydrolase [Planctomycetes bacterium]|nr:alpha/beta hydrolase [Planctomycetota bacterium]